MAAEQQRERSPRPADPAGPRSAPVREPDPVPAPVREPAPVSAPAGRARPPVTARGAAALQRQAGNRAVSGLLANSSRSVQRLAGAPARPATPSADPKFASLTSEVAAKRTTLTSHQPPASVAGAAQSAAVAPPDDQQAQGKAAQAEKMNAAKPGEFDKAAFVVAVNEAIAAQAPKNLAEADDFAGSGKADVVKGQVAGKVAGGRQASAAAIDGATKAAPDTSAAKIKPVTPLAPDRPPGPPAAPDPGQAVPDRVPPAATDFSAGPRQIDAEMAEAGVTDRQLKADPEFEGALVAKQEAAQHSAAAPEKLRASEAGTLSAAKAQAAMSGAAAMTAMTGDRTHSGAAVQQGQQGTKSADEKRRAEATARLQKVFDATKADVEGILAGLDRSVDEQFTRDEKQARDAFTAEHQRKMDEYKDKRYSGLIGKGRWIKDKFAGLPEEANQIFVTARTGYVSRMQGVISRIADTIGATLGRAKARIATGRTELQAEVQKLPADLQRFGRAAAADFGDRFDELTESVDAKSKELVQTLASKYSEAMKSVDEEIEVEKEANQGIVAKAVNAVQGAITTILALKDLLLNVLARAAAAVAAIIKDPIAFLGNLVSAVGSGLKSFLSNIGTHLKNGLVGWLLGAMASTGLQMPAKFDLKGIIGMIASLLGVTWNAIRGRIVSRGVPDQAVTAVEESEPLAQKLKTEGVGGIWETIAERVGDLKDKLLSKISEYLIPTVLIAGITWLISMLNPASAFIKACKLIIDFVTFIVERGAQIGAFVNSVLDAVIAIAGGGGGGVGALIEKALAGSIPVLIGALAAFLGIGGIATKVKAFFQSLTRPVMKAVDWVADKLVAFGKKIWGKLKAGAGKLKDKVTGKGPGQTPGPQQAAPESGRPAVRPSVDLPFSMAGESHTVTLAPKGNDVDVSMSSVTLPLTTKFKDAHLAIDNFRQYMSTIEDPDIRARYEAELLPKIVAFAVPSVAQFKSVYKEFFPPGGPLVPLGKSGEDAAKAKIRPLVTRGEQLVRQIQEWGSTTGISDLTKERITETLRVEGRRIWFEKFQRTQAEIAEVIGGFTYKGEPLQYVGSAKTGWKGPHKGSVRFDLADFDVDLYVVHAEDFEATRARNPGAVLAGKIFPSAAPQLQRLSNDVARALVARFPDVHRIGESSVVLRATRP